METMDFFESNNTIVRNLGSLPGLINVLSDEMLLYRMVKDDCQRTEGSHFEMNAFYQKLSQEMEELIAEMEARIFTFASGTHLEIGLRNYLQFKNEVEPKGSCELFIQLQYLKHSNECIIKKLRAISTMRRGACQDQRCDNLIDTLIQHHEAIADSIQLCLE